MITLDRVLSAGLDIFPEVVDEEAFAGSREYVSKRYRYIEGSGFAVFSGAENTTPLNFFQYAVMFQRVVREENGRVGEKIDRYIPAGQLPYKIHSPV